MWDDEDIGELKRTLIAVREQLRTLGWVLLAILVALIFVSVELIKLRGR